MLEPYKSGVGDCGESTFNWYCWWMVYKLRVQGVLATPWGLNMITPPK